ncbi:type II toxin-antitoxin system VapC family toxin [Candidatus Pacearchaeota archaeon]|nr:type II toxin-antitoxin system VapC family toxin [Candidatus Pacearchaeota archaeon]
MVDYCLDTNIIIEFFKGNEEIVKKINALFEKDRLFINSISLCEIYRGIYLYSKDKRLKKELDDLKSLLHFATFVTLDFDSSEEFGKLSYELKKKGKPTQEADLMIASICKTNNLVLVTKDKKHFKNLGIKVEDW